MAIVLNQYIEIREDSEGNSRLFGKCGFQTMSPKTDKYTLANLAAIERALDAGTLTDLDGNVVKDGAVILLPCRVSKVKDTTEIDQVTSIRTVSGEKVSVPAPTASSEPDPF
jgi:ribosomal protein L15